MTTIENPADGIYTAGQPTKEQLEQLAGDGVTAVINLRAEQELGSLGFAEDEVVKGAGMAYVWLPVSGPGDLTRALVDEVDNVLAKHDSVLIHCASSNRVGGVLALRQGWIVGESAEAALDFGKKGGLASLEPHIARLLGA